jgi:hypothetical protein
MNVYEQPPSEVIVLDQEHWKQVQALDPMSDPKVILQVLIARHLEHVRAMAQEAQPSEQDGLLCLTDVDHTDLTIIDVHFPAIPLRKVYLCRQAAAETLILALTPPSVMH